MKNKLGFIVVCCVFILTAVGCNNPGKKAESRLAIIKTTNPPPVVIGQHQNTNLEEHIKKDVSSLPELYDVAVIRGKKDVLVAYKVKHLHRFKMKQIEKNINKMLEKEYPKENFTVSSDYKIFLEAIRLNEQIQSRDISNKKAEKRLKQIIKMTNEMT